MSDPMSPSRKSLRCWLGMHTYAKHLTDEGTAYLECVRCRKESYPSPVAGLGGGL